MELNYSTPKYFCEEEIECAHRRTRDKPLRDTCKTHMHIVGSDKLPYPPTLKMHSECAVE